MSQDTSDNNREFFPGDSTPEEIMSLEASDWTPELADETSPDTVQTPPANDTVALLVKALEIADTDLAEFDPNTDASQNTDAPVSFLSSASLELDALARNEEDEDDDFADEISLASLRESIRRRRALADPNPEELEAMTERLHDRVSEVVETHVAEDLKNFAETLDLEQMSLELEAELEPEIEAKLLLAANGQQHSFIENDTQQTTDEAEATDSEDDGAPALSEVDEARLAQLDPIELKAGIQSVLFISDKPVSLTKFCGLFEQNSEQDIQTALTQLQSESEKLDSGLELAAIAGGFQYRTKSIFAPYLKKLSRVQVQRLSRGAMETLTIIAFKQPCMKDQVDEIRGVDSSHFVRTLLDRKLIEVSGRSELPGRPMLYTTTDEFLAVFGLDSLQALPPSWELESMVPASDIGSSEDDSPQARELRKLVGQMNSDRSLLNYDPHEDEVFLKSIKDKVKSIEVTTPSLQAIDAPPALEETKEAGPDTTPQQIDELLIDATDVSSIKHPTHEEFQLS